MILSRPSVIVQFGSLAKLYCQTPSSVTTKFRQNLKFSPNCLRHGQYRYFQEQPKRSNQKFTRRKTSLTPESDSSTLPIDSRSIRKLLKPLGFTVLFTCCSFAGATIWQYEVIRKQAVTFWNRTSPWGNTYRNSSPKFGAWRAKLNQYWNSFSVGERLALGIIGLNTFVFLLWRIPILQPTMIKYFCSNPVAKAVCWPMVLSTFSHYSFFHLAINMYVLFSFSNGIVNALGQEQFLAMYLSAGVVSSLASYLHKIVTMRSGLSLGASGCLMGVLGFFCTNYPNTHLQIIFLPMFTFSAGMALKGIIAIDTLGVLLGWKIFDHAAHLGGMLFGVSYALWGREYIWNKREPFLRWWNDIRGR